MASLPPDHRQVEKCHLGRGKGKGTVGTVSTGESEGYIDEQSSGCLVLLMRHAPVY
jgi:hypothetical protein